MISIDKTRIALIPSYEPDKALVDLVLDMHKSGFEAVVVNDGSGAQYDGIFASLPACTHIISYAENMGKGHALKVGLQYIKEAYHGEYTVVTMDSDGQHIPSDALNVCAEAEKNPGKIILGSRKQGKNTPFRSRFGNCITRNICRFAGGPDVYDTQTGLRAFDKSLIPFLTDISGERYEYEMNVLLETSKRDIPIKEIAIQTIYIDGNSGSHFKKIKDSLRIYREIIRFSLSSLAGFTTDYIIYSLMMLLQCGIVPANITARIISMTLNYCINYKLVFKNFDNILKSAVKYFILALCILAGNTALLGYINVHFGINPFFAKIVTELVFFACSFIVQRTFVFRKGNKVV